MTYEEMAKEVERRMRICEAMMIEDISIAEFEDYAAEMLRTNDYDDARLYRQIQRWLSCIPLRHWSVSEYDGPDAVAYIEFLNRRFVALKRLSDGRVGQFEIVV